MATQTEHLGLHQWEPGDPFLRADFNEDFAKIDAAVKTKGNCRIVTGSYVGNGKNGQYYPNTLTFPGKPLVVVINQRAFLCAVYGAASTYGFTQGGSVTDPTLTWEGNSVSWYHYYNADFQLNTAGTKYLYIALIAED